MYTQFHLSCNSKIYCKYSNTLSNDMLHIITKPPPKKNTLKDFVKKSTPRNNQLKKRHEKNDFHTEESTIDLLKMALPLDI